MSSTALTPRKQPRQSRSRVTVEAIIDAATRVLAQDSLEGFNTNRVAEVAGVSIGSLYQYFPNKAALISTLIDRAHADLAQSFRALLDGLGDATLMQALQAVAQLAVDQQYGNPVLAAALDHEEKRLPLQDQLAASDQALLDAIGQFLHHYRDDIVQPLSPSAARDCLVITRAMVEADMERGTPPSADLQARVVRALAGYLTV